MKITRALANLGVLLLCALLLFLSGTAPASGRSPASGPWPASAAVAAAANCTVPSESGAAVPQLASGAAAVRWAIGVAKTMNVPRKGQIIAVMVMYQETTLRNLANDGSSPSVNWPAPGRAYWLSVTRLSLKYPHDKFGALDGAHDTDSIGLFQQRPAYGWGSYGGSTGVTDPEGVVQRLLDPRWESMAFFGGPTSASVNTGLLNVPGWQNMTPADAAEAVQGSTMGNLYAQWEASATRQVDNNQDAPAVALPWYRGGGGGALTCTSIPTDPALGEAGRNPFGVVDDVAVQGTAVRVAGWALDPDAVNGTTALHFYDFGPNGTRVDTRGLANLRRDDVNRVYNLLGNFGFDAQLSGLESGHHTICVYAINVARGTGNAELGCRDVDLPTPSIPGAAVSVRPARIADSRSNLQVHGAVPGQSTVTVQVTGRGGVPAGVSAVVLNVTVIKPRAAGYLSVWPSGLPWTGTSNLNFSAGQDIPSAVVVAVNGDGAVQLLNGSAAPLDLAIDVDGYILSGTPADAGALVTIAPARVADSRINQQIRGSVAGYGSTTVKVAGVAGVPARNDVSAVLVTVTAVRPLAAGFVSVGPSGRPWTGTSTLNFQAGQNIPNLAVVPVGADGSVQLLNGSAGPVDLLVDVDGYVLDGTPVAAGAMTSVPPARVADSRISQQISGAIPGMGTAAVQVAGRGGVPAHGVTSVVLNVTAVYPAAEGFLSVWPAGSPWPGTSNLNFQPRVTIPNAVVVPVGADGKVQVFNGSGGPVDLVVDVDGYILTGPG